jgi:hypothetical protein
MRVKASLQFSCATVGRNLEIQLITDTRNLVIFRPCRRTAVDVTYVG